MRFESAFWNGVYKKISPDATVFCTNHVWKRWFWPQKVEHKRTLRLVESKITMWNMIIQPIEIFSFFISINIHYHRPVRRGGGGGVRGVRPHPPPFGGEKNLRRGKKCRNSPPPPPRRSSAFSGLARLSRLAADLFKKKSARNLIQIVFIYKANW